MTVNGNDARRWPTATATATATAATAQPVRRGAGLRRRHRRHPGLAGPFGGRLPRLPGRGKPDHRRRHGPARQDLPHRRLRHVHHFAQAGGVHARLQHRRADDGRRHARWKARRAISRSKCASGRAASMPSKCTGCGDCWHGLPGAQRAAADRRRSSRASRWTHADAAKLDEILARHAGEPGRADARAAGHQREPTAICRALVLEHLASRWNVQLAEILRVASFYDAFRFEPVGRHVVEVCAGTSCYARGSGALLERLEKEIGVGAGRDRPVGAVHAADGPLPRAVCPVAGDEDRRPQLRPRRTSTGFRRSWSNSHEPTHSQRRRPRPGRAPPGGRRSIRSRLKILIGSASCGVAVGRPGVEAAAVEAVEELGLDAVVCRTGCIGFCAQEPLLDLVLPDGPRVSYGQHDAREDPRVAGGLRRQRRPAAGLGPGPLRERRASSRPAKSITYPAGSQTARAACPSGRRSISIAARRRSSCGTAARSIRCRSTRPSPAAPIAARCARSTQMTPEEVIDEMIQSGLRGRGGAAFPTGQKWRFARQAAGDVKYVVCNADEGEPGAYMDRTVLEGDPHAILEGMLIGSYAIGAARRIRLRPQRVSAGHRRPSQHAIDEAEKRGLLGDDIFGSGWSFRVTVRRGAGAYVCGEETALIESIEGHAGEPRTRPPYPVTAACGASRPWSTTSRPGPASPRSSPAAPPGTPAMGTERTPGTTVFSLEGAVKNAGLVEVPLGHVAPRDGLRDRRRHGRRPAAQGASRPAAPRRGCIPPSMLDLADRHGRSRRRDDR